MRQKSVLLGFLVSAVFLYLAFRKTDINQILSHLRAADYWWLLPASLLTLVALWIRSVRWGVLIAPIARVPPGVLYSATMIGFMCNNVLPMRAGEVIRAFLLKRKSGLRASAAFATIVVERLLDLFFMIAAFGAILLLVPFHNRQFKMGVLMAFGAGLLVLGLLILLRVRGEAAFSLPVRLLGDRLGGRVRSALESFRSGLLILKSPRQLVQATALTVLMWACITFVIWMCIRSARLPETAPVPPSASLVLLVVIAIGVMIPSGPGFVGTMQAASVLGLAVVGFHHKDQALSFSILYHATQWFPVVAVGLIFLFRENLSLRRIQDLSRSAQEQEEAH